MSKLNNLKKVVIIDYEMSNLFSVKNVLELFPINAVITNDLNELISADAAVLPGVGAFKEAMLSLRKLDLISPIKDHVMKQKPFLGICLGFQLLFSESFEFGLHKGIGIYDGEVLSLKKKVRNGKIPHVGWNQVIVNEKLVDTKGLFNENNNEYFYFVHSYYVKPQNDGIILTNTTYENFDFCSAILDGNIIATQFHPEKSGVAGIYFLKNFLLKNKLIGDTNVC